MNKLQTWISELTAVGKVSLLATIVLGGMFTASAIPSPTSTTPPNNIDSTKIDPIVTKKIEPVITTKTEKETEDIPFVKQTIESSDLVKGKTQIQTVGVNGIKTITYTITLTDGVETNRTSTEAITTEPVNEVTVIGTYVEPVSNCDPNYSPCVPYVSYDLDCSDISFSVTVIGTDRHGFDRDKDGYGCESN